MLAENSNPQAPTYLRNIQTGKSKKKSLIPREGPRRREISITAPTYLRNIEEGKTEKKSWYQHVFFAKACKAEETTVREDRKAHSS
jgi:hypothetical protein